MVRGNFLNITREQSYPTPIQNSTLLPVLLLSLTSQKHSPDTKSFFAEEYDYIVVGAGSAGSVIASRLSEIETKTVLLLEAGPTPPLLTEVPVILAPFLGSDIDWSFSTEPQNYTARLQKNRQLLISSGKTIGGSSAINFMNYIRGHPQNYDDWEAQGAKGWSWNHVLPYFKKSEDNRDPRFIRNGYHGVGGPMTVEDFDKELLLFNSVVNAHLRLGYPYVLDPTGPNQIGVSFPQGNLRHRQRCSTAKGYLVPAESRRNLDILAEAFVTKILIDDKRVRGVQFDYNGTCHEVRARTEVILSAGVYNSPKLLQLSGIGPKEILTKCGVPLVANLPVGEYHQNHVASLAFFSANSTLSPITKRIQNPNNIWKYIRSRNGVLANSFGIFGMSFLKDSLVSPPFAVPDYQVYFIEVDIRSLATGLNIREEVYDQYFAPYENGTNFACLAFILSPRSRGDIFLRSSDPYEYPAIQPNHFQHPEDVRIAVEALKHCYKIMESPEMQRLGVKRFSTVIPGCEDVYGDENRYLECNVKSLALSGLHTTGSVKMGDPKDTKAVVDPQLRVKGIKGLRVVDASVMPVIPTGNINNVVIMIAEKASDMIKKDILGR